MGNILHLRSCCLVIFLLFLSIDCMRKNEMDSENTEKAQINCKLNETLGKNE